MQRWLRYFYGCLAVLTLTVISALGLAPATVLAYWDNLGGRPALTLTGGDENGDGATFLDEEGNPRSFIGDYTPVFNSITNNPNYGDERNFVTALAIDQDIHGAWNSNTITAEDGKVYLVRIYVHNNNPNGEDATATDTKVAFSIPTASDSQIEVGGWLNSSNANATQIYDGITFQAPDDQPFHLEYVYGSATLYNNGFAGPSGTGFPDDSIVTNASGGGALIGYEDFDGRIPGCFKYTQLVCIKVKVIYDYEFTVDVKVRLAGTEDEFAETIEAEVCDKVEFQIHYQNTAPVSENNTEQNERNIQHSVMIRDVLPDNMVYVPNSTYLYNSNYRDGTLLTPDGDLFTRAINIGNYGPQSNGYVRFTAEVVDKSLAVDKNVLVNWAQATVSSTVHQDHAKTRVQKPETAKTVIRIIILGIIILCLIDIVRLRHKLRQLRQ